MPSNIGPSLHTDRSSPEAPTVGALLVLSPICVDCLSWRIGIPRWQTYAALQRLSATVEVRMAMGRCERCLRERVVHRVA